MKVAIRCLIWFDKAIGLKIASLAFPSLTQMVLLKLCNLCYFQCMDKSGVHPWWQYITTSVGKETQFSLNHSQWARIQACFLLLLWCEPCMDNLLRCWWAMSWEHTGWYLLACQQLHREFASLEGQQRQDFFLTKDYQTQFCCTQEFYEIWLAILTHTCWEIKLHFIRRSEGKTKLQLIRCFLAHSRNYTHLIHDPVLCINWLPRLQWSRLMLKFLFSTEQFTWINYVVYWWKRNNHLYPYSWRERVRQSARHWLIIIDGDSLSLSNRMASWLLMLGRGGLHMNRHWLLFMVYWANQGDGVNACCRLPVKPLWSPGWNLVQFHFTHIPPTSKKWVWVKCQD